MRRLLDPAGRQPITEKQVHIIRPMMKPGATERLTDKIIVEQTPNHLHVQFDTPYQVISSAVLGGGFVEASHILNLKVRYPTNRQQEQGPIQSQLPPIRKQKKSNTAASMFYLGKHLGVW